MTEKCRCGQKFEDITGIRKRCVGCETMFVALWSLVKANQMDYFSNRQSRQYWNERLTQFLGQDND